MAAPGQNLRIDGDRLWDTIHAMAEIGPGVAGGSNRQALTDADGEGRHLFRRWCEAAGCTVGVDAMGTMFATRPGTDPDAAPVMVGSHLDTQPTGGRYDGVLGVLGALEIVRSMNDLDIRTKHPVTVVNFTNEEGSRFAPAMMASAVFAGMLPLEEAHAVTDAEGKRFGDELERIGWKGEEAVGARDIHAFFELHIEQGPILEAEGVDIGIVTHGQGLRWIECTVTGVESHAGSTPMPLRKDAGRGMARVVEAVNRIAMDHQPNAVGTVGQGVLHPNSPNIIPGRAVFTVDIRSHEIDRLKDMEARVLAEGEALCAELGLGFEGQVIGAFDPPAFDPALLQALRDAAERLGYSHRDIVSGAGHDACAINRVAPTAMVMCPCVGGLSHNEAEEITKEWSTAGAEVLFHAVLETAEVVG